MLDTTASAIAGSVTMGALVLFVTLANLALPPYGDGFLAVLASIYPGYEAEANLPSIALVTGYAIVDGAILGFAVSWIHNRLHR